MINNNFDHDHFLQLYYITSVWTIDSVESIYEFAFYIILLMQSYVAVCINTCLKNIKLIE